MADASAVGPRPIVTIAVACESVSTDAAGRISLHNLIDGLRAASFPATTPQFHVVFQFFAPTCSGYIGRLSLEVVAGSDGSSIAAIDLPEDLPLSPTTPRAHVVVGLDGITWPHPGDYSINLKSNGDLLAGLWMNIAPIGAPQDS